MRLLKNTLFALGPLIMAAHWPFLNYLSTNIRSSAYVDAVLDLYLFYILLVGLGALVTRLVLIRRPLANALDNTAVAILLVFAYALINDAFSALGIELNTVRLAVWLVLSALVLTCTAFVVPSRVLRQVLTVSLLALLILPTGKIVVALATGQTAPDRESGIRSSQQSNSRATAARHVFWFIFDGYARQDVLWHQLDLDNMPFLADLEQQGFQVAYRGMASYGNTYGSISTTSQQRHLIDDGHAIYNMYDLYKRLNGFNRTVENFKRDGYLYVHSEAGGGVLKSRCGSIADVCLVPTSERSGFLNQADLGFLRLTPFYPVVKKLAPSLMSTEHAFPSQVVQKLVGMSTEEPMFVFAHFMIPHYPQKYDANCAAAAAKLERLDLGYKSPEAARNYRNDIICLNLELREALPRLITRYPDAIVIVQADHGAALLTSERPVDGPDNFLHFLPFNAIRLPEHCRSFFYESISLVNTFPLVTACLNGRTPELLPDHAFIYVPDNAGERQVIDVTPEVLDFSAQLFKRWNDDPRR